AEPGAAEAEEIREPDNRHRPVVARRAVPHLAQRASVAPADAVDRRRRRDLEAGAEDDRVDRVFGPVGTDNSVLAHLTHASGDDVDVGLVQRLVPVIRDEDPLATDLKVRLQLRSQLRVADALAQVDPAERLHADPPGRTAE